MEFLLFLDRHTRPPTAGVTGPGRTRTCRIPRGNHPESTGIQHGEHRQA